MMTSCHLYQKLFYQLRAFEFTPIQIVNKKAGPTKHRASETQEMRPCWAFKPNLLLIDANL